MSSITFDPSGDTMENILLRRGLEVVAFGDGRKVLYPVDEATLPGQRSRVFAARPTYYRCMGNTQFRKTVNQLIVAGSDGCPVDHLRAIAGARIEDYRRLLVEDLGIAIEADNRIALTRASADLGSSLEEYVAHLCESELRGRAKWGVKVRGLPSGGDFDVLAWLAPNLVYVECKSGNPQNVDTRQPGQFVKRHRELGADLSVLLIDTDGPLDFVVDRFNAQIQTDYSTNDDVIDAYPIRRRGIPFMLRFDEMRVQQSTMYPSICFGYHRLYVIGNKPSILTQLRRCLMHYHAYMKQFDLLIAKSFSG